MSNVFRLGRRVSVTLMVAVMVFLIPLVSYSAQSGSEAKAESASASALIDINTADSTQLSTLPGIGPEIAERIVAYRSEHGLFKTTQDLGNVKGIGEKKLSKIASLIVVKKSAQ